MTYRPNLRSKALAKPAHGDLRPGLYRTTPQAKRLCAAVVCMALTIPATAKAQEAGPVIDRPFIALSLGLTAASVFDAWTTRRALSDCRTCREVNPVAAHFVNTDLGAYGFAIGTSALFIGGAYILKKRGYRYKWALIAPTVLHVTAGGLNLRFVH